MITEPSTYHDPIGHLWPNRAKEPEIDPMVGRMSRSQRASPVDWLDTSPTAISFMACPDLWRILLGPNQGGKTVVGARELIYSAGVRPHPYRKRFNADRPWSTAPIKAWLFARTTKQAVVPQRRVYDLTPPSRLVTKDFNEDRGFLHGRIEFTNGSWVKVKTADQDPVNHASEDLDLIWADEPWDPAATSNFAARLLVRSGSMFATLTPVDAPIDHIEKAVEDNVLTAFRFGLTVDNCPHLSQRQIDRVTKQYEAHEVAQRVHALWRGPTKGRVCSLFQDITYSEAGRVVDWGHVRPHGWLPAGKQETQIILAIDYGEIGERTVAVLLAKRGNVVMVLADYACGRATTLTEDCWGITDMLRLKGLKLADVDLIVGDTNTAGKLAPGWTMNDLLRDELARIASLTVPIVGATKGAGSIETGTHTINQRFGRGELLICQDAPRVLAAVRHWKGTNNGKDKDYKHAFDAFRYGEGAFENIGTLLTHLRLCYR